MANSESPIQRPNRPTTVRRILLDVWVLITSLRDDQEHRTYRGVIPYSPRDGCGTIHTLGGVPFHCNCRVSVSGRIESHPSGPNMDDDLVQFGMFLFGAHPQISWQQCFSPQIRFLSSSWWGFC